MQLQPEEDEEDVEDAEDAVSALGLVVEATLVWLPGREVVEVPAVLEVPELTLRREAEVLVPARLQPTTACRTASQ